MDFFTSLASLAGDEWLDAAVASQNSSVPSPDGTGEPETLPHTPRQQHFVPKTPVATVANELIVGASDEVRSRIREHLLKLRRPIRIATACSGTDLCIPVLQTLEAVLLDIFSMNNFMRCEMFEHCWSCEKEGFKQRFICEVHKVDHLYEDLTQLGCTTGYNLITGAVEHIPSFDLLICGWSCKDISMLNTKRIKDSDQLIGSHGTSGTTFHGTVSIVETHRPKAIIMENVLGVLRSASDATTGASGPDTAIEGGQEADWVDDDLINDKMRDYITKVFNQIGYVIHFRQLNACDHGFPQSRRRAYMIAVRRDAAGLGDRASQGSLAMLKKIDAAYDNLGKPMMQPIENFLLEDLEREEWQAFSEPREVADDAPLAKRKKLQWAALHDRLFSAKGFLWPPSAEVMARTRARGLNRREGEVLHYMCSVHDSTSEEQIVDLSQGLDRVFFCKGKSCCLTPNAILWLRNRDRRLLGEEALRIQGLWLESRVVLRNFTDRQLRDLGGNSFSAGCLMTAVLSLLATCDFASP